MKTREPKLLLTTSPFIKSPHDTRFIMWQVNYALLPVILASVYYFGINAVLLIAVSLAGALLPEWIWSRQQNNPVNTIRDGSAVITGLLFALTLPPGIPLWMAFLGGVVSVVLGKILFGGLGYNIFNPALVGRAFLQAAFPVSMTTWMPHASLENFFQIRGDLLTLPFMKPRMDALSAATPLAKMKFEMQPTGITDLLLGSTAGSLGETAAVIILLAGIYLAIRGVINWRIPVGILATVFVLATLLHWVDGTKYPAPWFHLFAGGLMLGAVFMATDPVTSPITQKGVWIFSVGVGLLVVVIRVWGGLPEGVMYSILLMNALTPLINKVVRPRIYGMRKSES
ncbi:MAG: RnfABCDGE type electron transport complex subunit D [Calditrichaeota bacterium]|nr:RnfABCDGE type electron transport complex subunit D [Calditrichota bacterium]